MNEFVDEPLEEPILQQRYTFNVPSVDRSTRQPIEQVELSRANLGAAILTGLRVRSALVRLIHARSEVSDAGR